MQSAMIMVSHFSFLGILLVCFTFILIALLVNLGDSLETLLMDRLDHSVTCNKTCYLGMDEGSIFIRWLSDTLLSQ